MIEPGYEAKANGDVPPSPLKLSSQLPLCPPKIKTSKFHSVSLLCEAPLVRGSSALPSVLKCSKQISKG